MARRLLFLLLLAFAASPWASPPLALVLGIGFALCLEHPYAKRLKGATRLLLQASVVGLGFGMNLQEVLRAGLGGLAYTAGGICFSLLCGALLGRLLRVPAVVSCLISTGTAICGGSAIAAMGPILGADQEEMSVSLGTVFLLNSVALFAFPWIGSALRLSQPQFGLWAALAIHDTSSVVGATVKYGAAALAMGTTIKLARALWIVPLSLGAAALLRSPAKLHWPWFILLFVLAAALNTYFPLMAGVYGTLNAAARSGLRVTLFLIGSGISKAAIEKLGARPFLQGVLLWLLVAGASLALILAGWIR